MKKSKERSSMTAAFVYYARLIGGEEWCAPPEAYIRIAGAIGKDRTLVTDVWAAGECMFILGVLGEKETLMAVREIYVEPFSKSPMRAVTKNEISMRVIRFAQDNHLDERTVYRRLRRARELWSSIKEELMRRMKNN